MSKDLTACEEFMQLISITHVMSAAIHIARTTSITDLSSKILSSDKPMVAMTSLVNTLCSQMVNIEFTAETSCPSNDGVLEYAKETLSLGLMLLEFKDAIVRGMETEYFDAGSTFSISFVLHNIKTIALRHSTF